MNKKSIHKNILLKCTGYLPKAKLPNTMTRITDYVYLGNYKDAMMICDSGINFKYILNLTTETYKLKNKNITIINIPITDDVKTNISIYFDDVTKFLSKCDERKTPVLVHCVAGVNRSGAMIMAYLMSKKINDIPDVIYFLYIYHYLREQRGAFIENPSFKKQIIDRYIS
nr:Tyr-Ser kinase [Wadden Sea poxvirus]